MTCVDHHLASLFVTHNGWQVLQCRSCGAGEIVLPEGVTCRCPECRVSDSPLVGPSKRAAHGPVPE